MERIEGPSTTDLGRAGQGKMSLSLSLWSVSTLDADRVGVGHNPRFSMSLSYMAATLKIICVV